MFKKLMGTLFCGIACLSLVGCDVDVKDEGKLPDVDVSVEEGEMPEVDVRGPDVDVETETVEVEVPSDVDVDIPQENEEVIDASAEDKD